MEARWPERAESNERTGETSALRWSGFGLLVINLISLERCLALLIVKPVVSGGYRILLQESLARAFDKHLYKSLGQLTPDQFQQVLQTRHSQTNQPKTKPNSPMMIARSKARLATCGPLSRA